MPIRSIIIDDEAHCRSLLQQLLHNFCPEVEVLAELNSIVEARSIIEELKPDLIFLDIEMPQQDGMRLFKLFPNPSFAVIFTTAHDKYAAHAFRLAALDYLLKPIVPEELQQAVQRVPQQANTPEYNQRLSLLEQQNANTPPTIALPSLNGYSFKLIDDIIRCEANRVYTNFYLVDGSQAIVSKPLKTFQPLLEDYGFFRVNRSHLVNLKYVESYQRSKQGEVVLKGGKVITLSEGRRRAFFQRMGVG